MITYQYQILRYMPDRVNGEFINLGAVIYYPNENELISQFSHKGSRISSIFPNTNTRYVIRMLKFLQSQIERTSKQLKYELSFEKFESLDNLTRKILPKDDSSLFFTEVKKGFDIDSNIALNSLYNRFIVQNDDDETKDSISDKEVWSKHYKEYFDKLGISSHLHAHTVVTNNDELEFEKAWKNGKWNCFESVSFNLSRPDAIKNKVYKWIGKIDELNTAKEPLSLYLLSVFPEHNNELQKFIVDKLGKRKGDKTEVKLVTEDNIQTIAEKIKHDIEHHQRNS